MRACAAAVLLLALAACGGGSATPVPPSALAIIPTVLASGAPGVFYSQALLATGGSGTGYVWSVAAGALPPGLGGVPAAGRNVTISGTVLTAGTWSFTVELRDSAGATVQVTYNLLIAGGGPGRGPGPGPGPGPSGGATSLVNAPAARGYHTAVWTGTEMIVWGGVDASTFLNSGAAYDPTADTWRTLTVAGAPTGRYGHTAVWTGSEMIVWGGWDGQGVVGTGGAYDPATDTWRTLASSGAPAPRASHTAVWTGSEMVVWGGEGVFPPPAPNAVDLVFGDGFAYAPATDSWRTISAAGPPPSRGHAAVWTGSRMIVWGGRDAFALTIVVQNTGGRYDVAGDTWTPTAAITAPAARVGHAAVWAGSRMVVWGGTVANLAPTQTGGRYDPSTDAWTPTSAAGAPSARSGAAGLWTGSEAVFWGGTGAAGALGDGRVYDPAADSWRALASTLAVTPRANHTAVWTGSRMIVWGGTTSPAITYLNTGAVLVP